jgi:hypothetical protein
MATSSRDVGLGKTGIDADSYDKPYTPLSNQSIPQSLGALGDIRGKRC